MAAWSVVVSAFLMLHVACTMATQRVNAHLSPTDVEKAHEIIQFLSSAIGVAPTPQRNTGTTIPEQSGSTHIDSGQLAHSRTAYRRYSGNVQQRINSPIGLGASSRRQDELPGPSSSIQSAAAGVSGTAIDQRSVSDNDQGDDISGQCDSALSTLQRARANLNLHRNRGIGSRYSQLFLRETKRSRDSGSLCQKRCRKTGWTHTFYCLSECQQSVIPSSNYERDMLLEAGLGEKKVFIPDVDASGEEFRSVLYEVYPKLKDAGGYAFGKCKANSKYVETLSSLCLMSPKVLRSRVGNARTYIIPMQRNLDLAPVLTDVKSKVFEKCLLCMEEVPFHSLNEHLAECAQKSSDKEPGFSSDEDYYDHTLDPELPSASHLFTNNVGTTELKCDEVLTNDSSSESATTLTAALEEISSRVQGAEWIFEVRRDHLLEDSFINVSSSEFNPANRIQVVFLGEEAEDGGGPRRELWRLLELAIKEKYFEGDTLQVIPRHDTVALQSNVFYKIGVLIATSIAQGGSGFPYLYEGVYEYLCGKEPNSVSTTASVIPDYAARSVVEKVIEATNNECMQNVVKENSELILDAGFTKSPSTVQLTDKEDIARALCLHYIVFKCKAELDQLKGGLHTLGVQTAMEVLPDEFKCLFTATKEILSPDKLKDIFLGRVLFSSSGDSIKIAKEHAVYTCFCDYLDECYKGDSVISLEEVLVFFTGASRIPPGGFDALNPPSLSFDHGAIYPQASTCALNLILPAKHAKYEDFKVNMDQALSQNGGFGCV